MIKVASYCRVSTDKEDQANSFESQQRFFREYIERHPQWELYEVYADEGITGTSTKKRFAFHRMMNDAFEGRFQLIITKEVSRFSRNILDTIRYTRELKTLGIGVVFMSDGFCSLDADAELRLAIMGSIAQEESRKTSSRVKWGQTRQMERGVVFGTSLLGYDVTRGKMTVNPQGAQIVRLIFHKYGVEKKGTTVIARELREAGYHTYSGSTIWRESHLVKILKNEKYVGDLVQKKTITPDYLTHNKQYNHGEEEKIVIKNHHEPIISRELWDLVQQELTKRRRTKASSGEHSNRYVFSGKIICAECGARFVSRKKVRKDGTSYRRWACYTATKEGKGKIDTSGNMIGCDVGMHIRDDLAMSMLTYVVADLPIDRDLIIRNVSAAVLCAKVGRNSHQIYFDKLRQQCDAIEHKKLKAIDKWLSGDLSDDAYSAIDHRYTQELACVQEQLKESAGERPCNEQHVQNELQQKIMAIINCEERSDAFLQSLLKRMTVHRDGSVEITLHELSCIWHFNLI